MNNEFLRVENQASHDNSVNKFVVSSKKKPVKTTKANNVNAIDWLIDEFNDSGDVRSIPSSISAPKPKLLKCIYLSLFLGIINLALAISCAFVNELFLVIIFILSVGISVPMLISYFIYSLATRSKTEFASILAFAVIGVGTCLVTTIISNSLRQIINSYVAYVVLSSVIELLLVVLCTIILVKYKSPKSVMSTILIAAVVAAGFSAGKAIIECFYELFVPYNFGLSNETVGAIINLKDVISKSTEALMACVFKVAIYKPFIFIMLVIVIVQILYENIENKTSKILISIFVTLFSIVICAFANLESNVVFLSVLYSIIAFYLTAMLGYRAINSAIRFENYEP